MSRRFDGLGIVANRSFLAQKHGGGFPVVNNLLGGAGSLGYGELVSGAERVGGRVEARANKQEGEADVTTTKMVYWQEDECWLGYLEEFPDYWTQGETLDDLKQHLRDLYADLTSGELPGVRRVTDLTLA